MHCICDQFLTGCAQEPTQEDLLCDECRAHPYHGYTGEGPRSYLLEMR